MLVLTRKKNQSIIINDEIEVFVVDISNEQVKIGIKAPDNVKIHRREIYDTIKKENKMATSSKANLSKLSEIKKK